MNDATNPKIAAEKARDTYRKTARRKTTRKVGTGKAQRTDRKTASKVVAEKARGPYRQTAHPKTTRKVGVAKALSRGRKTASKVAAENARGTYRKTAARFEEFAYDGQIPESMHALAATSVAQTREFYVHSLEAVLGGWERFVVGAQYQQRFRSCGEVGRGENPGRGYGIADKLLAQAGGRTGVSKPEKCAR